MKRVIEPCVYIVASRRNGTMYIGVTSNLLQRIHQHRTGAVAGFLPTTAAHVLSGSSTTI